MQQAKPQHGQLQFNGRTRQGRCSRAGECPNGRTLVIVCLCTGVERLCQSLPLVYMCVVPEHAAHASQPVTCTVPRRRGRPAAPWMWATSSARSATSRARPPSRRGRSARARARARQTPQRRSHRIMTSFRCGGACAAAHEYACCLAQLFEKYDIRRLSSISNLLPAAMKLVLQ